MSVVLIDTTSITVAPSMFYALLTYRVPGTLFYTKYYSCTKPEEFRHFGGTARRNSSGPGTPFRSKLPEVPAPAGIKTESGRKVQLSFELDPSIKIKLKIF
jgi:hypothetical protein